MVELIQLPLPLFSTIFHFRTAGLVDILCRAVFRNPFEIENQLAFVFIDGLYDATLAVCADYFVIDLDGSWGNIRKKILGFNYFRHLGLSTHLVGIAQSVTEMMFRNHDRKGIRQPATTTFSQTVPAVISR